MTTFRSISLVTAIVFVFCGTARAATLFYDDFESDTAGTMPTDAALDLDPAIGAGDTGQWLVDEAAQSYLQVWNNATPAHVPTATAGENKYASLYRPNCGAADASYWAQGWNAASTTDQKLNLSFKAFIETQWSGENRLSVIGWSAPDRAYGTREFHVYLSAGGPVASVMFYDGGTQVIDTGLSFPAAQWTDVSLAIDMAAKKYDITVNGNTYTDAYWTGASTTLGSTWLVMNDMEEHVFFDNMSLSTVPEPTSLAILSTGLLGLLAYAWRKRR